MTISVKTLNTDQKLFLVGIQHTSDPDDTQFGTIDTIFTDFLKSKEKKIAILEGNAIPERLITNNREEVISSLGERGYMIKILNDKKIPYVFSDSTILDEYNYLIKKFSKESVSYYLFIRTLGGLLRKRKDGNFDEILIYTANSLNSEISEINLTKEKILDMHEKFSSQELTKKNFNEIIKSTYPDKRRKNIINKVACDSSSFRDNSLLEKIKETLFKKRINIFVLFGEHHIKMISSALNLPRH